jgi:hypothetical protein
VRVGVVDDNAASFRGMVDPALAAAGDDSHRVGSSSSSSTGGNWEKLMLGLGSRRILFDPRWLRGHWLIVAAAAAIVALLLGRRRHCCSASWRSPLPLPLPLMIRRPRRAEPGMRAADGATESSATEQKSSAGCAACRMLDERRCAGVRTPSTVRVARTPLFSMLTVHSRTRPSVPVSSAWA